MKELDAITPLLAILPKYQDIDATDVEIKVEKFSDGVILTVKGKDFKLGDMLAELLIAVAKISEKEDNPLKLEIINNRD